METLAKAFDNAHGFRFKSAFAETLVQLLHPVAKVRIMLIRTITVIYAVILIIVFRRHKRKSTTRNGPKPSR